MFPSAPAARASRAASNVHDQGCRPGAGSCRVLGLAARRTCEDAEGRQRRGDGGAGTQAGEAREEAHFAAPQDRDTPLEQLLPPASKRRSGGSRSKAVRPRPLIRRQARSVSISICQVLPFAVPRRRSRGRRGQAAATHTYARRQAAATHGWADNELGRLVAQVDSWHRSPSAHSWLNSAFRSPSATYGWADLGCGTCACHEESGRAGTEAWTCSDVQRRAATCSDVQRRAATCSDVQRRAATCSDVRGRGLCVPSCED
jgi:hypothetical protein